MNQIKKNDIRTREDLHLVVRRFYEKAIDDPIIGFFFTQVEPLNLDLHVPKVVDFWETMILGTNVMEKGKYAGNMLEVHINVDKKARMQTGHFTRWLYLFHGSVDHFYQGTNADKLKHRATKMAGSMSDALRTKRGEDRVGVERLNES
jgi:hemoglobin